MKRMMILVLLTVVSMGLNAQDEKVKVDIGKFEGGVITEKAQSREVTKNEKDEEVVTYKVTITVTPDEGFFITKEDIDVEATLPLPQKDTDTRADKEEEQTTELAGKLELVGDEPDDLSEEREYTFTVEDGYGAWVMAANFHTAALVLGSDVKEIADGSLVGVKSITIENNQKVIGLGDNDVKDLPVIVPANLYNEYKTTEGWREAKIMVDENNSVEMGLSFTEKNDYAVFYSEKAVLVPSVLKGYTVNGRDKDGKLILNDVGTVIPAGEPVLLFSKEIDDDDFRTVASEPEKVEEVKKTRATDVKNALMVVTDDTKTDEYGLYVELGQVYMLYNDVFYFTQAGYIPVGGIYLDPKALVVVDEEEPAAPLKARFFIGLPDDEATAISATLIDKGQMINDKWYDLNGRRLNGKPTAKGVYINNGKKYVVK
jgi:hypothetical protein